MRLKEKERRRVERASHRAKAKRLELVERAKTDIQAMGELAELRAKEAEARAKRREKEQERIPLAEKAI